MLAPISRRVLAKDDQALVGFEPFFTHILMHELMHGLGPQTIRVGSRETTVRQELKELNGTLEEAKADISGLWALQYLADKGVVPKSQERAFYTTFLASTFRTLRFGFTDSHAKGMALQVNTLLDQGAIEVQPDGTFRLDFAKARKGGHGVDTGDHDHPGDGRLLPSQSVARAHGGDPTRGEAPARSSQPTSRWTSRRNS